MDSGEALLDGWAGADVQGGVSRRVADDVGAVQALVAQGLDGLVSLESPSLAGSAPSRRGGGPSVCPGQATRDLGGQADDEALRLHRRYLDAAC